MTTIGIVGAGNVGSTVARKALASGYQVVLANAQGPESLKDLVAELGDRARAATVEQAVQEAHLVFVSVPIDHYTDLPPEPFAGKIVIDTGNYLPAWNGHIAALDDESTTTSELLQAHLVSARVVKAFNNLAAPDLLADGLPSGTPDRRALAVASDDEAAKAQVSGLIDAFGFDVVDAGPLSEGWRYQRDLQAYGVRRNLEQMRGAFAQARRYRDM